MFFQALVGWSGVHGVLLLVHMGVDQNLRSVLVSAQRVQLQIVLHLVQAMTLRPPNATHALEMVKLG